MCGSRARAEGGALAAGRCGRARGETRAPSGRRRGERRTRPCGRHRGRRPRRRRSRSRRWGSRARGETSGCRARGRPTTRWPSAPPATPVASPDPRGGDCGARSANQPAPIAASPVREADRPPVAAVPQALPARPPSLASRASTQPRGDPLRRTPAHVGCRRPIDLGEFTDRVFHLRAHPCSMIRHRASQCHALRSFRSATRGYQMISPAQCRRDRHHP